MKPELLNPDLPVCDLGEGPHWDAAAKRLYWVDITGRILHSADAGGKNHSAFQAPAMIGFAVTDDSGRIVAGLQDGLYNIDASASRIELLAHVDHASPGNRFNDGKCDPYGRLWAGTMHATEANAQATGALYRFNRTGLHVQETGMHISNGLGWSPDNKIMYYSDTVKRTIWQYDYDIETGEASGKRIFARFEGTGRPDGLCIDSQGRVLVALWPGWGVDVYMPDGKLERKIDLPVPQVSSCAFGAEDLKTLYITTARAKLKEDALQAAPLSGRIFAMPWDTAGQPVSAFKRAA
jgi:sugar lactone lactonase YvrE